MTWCLASGASTTGAREPYQGFDRNSPQRPQKFLVLCQNGFNVDRPRFTLPLVLEAEMTEALGAEKGERASGRQAFERRQALGAARLYLNGRYIYSDLDGLVTALLSKNYS